MSLFSNEIFVRYWSFLFEELCFPFADKRAFMSSPMIRTLILGRYLIIGVFACVIINETTVLLVWVLIIAHITLGLIFSVRFWGCPRGAMVKAMNSGIVVRKFELHLRYYVPFWTSTIGKSMNTLILPAVGWIVPLHEDDFGIQ